MQPLHTTRLEISLKALTHNYQFIRSLITPSTKMMAVVKAMGYGSDDIAIAHHLQSLGVDYLAVVFAQEGIALRRQGIKLPILVFHPLPDFCQEMITYRLEPALYNRFILKEFLKSAAIQTNYPVHIKVDTGLHRLGFTPQDMESLIEDIHDHPTICVQSVYSHLAASEDPKSTDFTKQQINTFSKVISRIRQKMDNPFMAHILNTSGIFNYTDAQMDMVRTGIGLYGFGAEERYSKSLRPISTLKTKISQINKLKAGDSIGYNRAFVASKPIKIATLPIGHADGIDRIYGRGKGYVYIHNQKAYIVGNVCMDMIMVDITDITCRVSDEVIFFDAEHSAEKLSEDVGTISYELITGIAPRVPRVIV